MADAAPGGPRALHGPDGGPYHAAEPEPRTGDAVGAAGVALAWFSKLFYGLAAAVLGGFSLGLMGLAAWRLVGEVLAGHDLLKPTLESIGLVTIGIAVYEVGKFIVEEELLHERERRSMVEARRSLTKFFTIVIIILSLEAIVLVFETKLERVSDLIYPTALMAVAVGALVGLGVFLRLSTESSVRGASSNTVG